ncbi:hypothetical protein PIB30_002140 [Stylosanthes scabra]|uniref:DYW domain-containing protein n=1 Tax=Stylosanthes scabra TaxID=79078 RepID=A0ABU6S3D9_9FABA|nr:hypothetical protein [Stylosanthes scabra]
MPSLSLSLSLPPPLNNNNKTFELRRAISTLDPARDSHDLLKSCIRSRNFALGKLLHRKLTESQLVLDSPLLNSLITLYSKSGQWQQALSIFQSMDPAMRDLVSWTAIVSCFANHRMHRHSLSTFIQMLRTTDFYPNEFSFTALLRSCSNAEFFSTGLAVFGFLLKTGYLDADVCVGCALIDMFVKGGGDLDSAFKVFDKMPEKNVVTWNLMITRFVHFSYNDDAFHLFFSMVESGFSPDRFTLSSVLSACAESELLALGKQLHSWVVKSGMGLDVCVGSSLVDMYAKCGAEGSVEDARKVFDRMPERNVVSWTAIIAAYVQGGLEREAVGLFGEMIQGYVAPNCFTFAGVLKACTNLPDFGLGEQLHSQTIKLGISAVNCVGNSLVNMYARSGRMECARKCFDILFEKSLILCDTAVDPNARNLDPEDDTLDLETEGTGNGPNAFTYGSLLSGAACIGTISKGEQIHSRVLKSGFRNNLCINNALISMYSKCGNEEAALRVFDDMEDRNVISWTSIISGFAKHGCATKALELFGEMLEAGVKPNGVTYIAVLSACSHVGLIDEAWKHFASMRRDHGIAPRTEHYACMVDLLGRSGLLSEAMEFINSMPFPADAMVWRTFLGSCRIHHNTKFGEHAAKKVLELEPHDPAAYILLSNLYAAEGRWDDVAAIRKNMKLRKLTKEAGCSWIEVENQVHKFHVGDTSHPEAQKIYDKLDELALKIRNLGYVPNTDSVLHDVEEELKEQFLFQHSEKIAVAFALISTKKPKPIRIFKNLRVCGDCHMAIKYISVVTGREIVVRDANRFHHFRDGKCSCNDYW